MSEQQTSHGNRRFWDAAKSVPEMAKKEIKAGKLKGYTNVSPQWRLEKLTEIFGPVGVGWVIENIKYWTTEGVGECVMWCSLDLRVLIDGKFSLPINGIGGSKLYGKGQGDGINDEACKMAQTDAISVACKNLGFAADVYYGLDDTKYRGSAENFQWGAPRQQPPQYQVPPQPPQTPPQQMQQQAAQPQRPPQPSGIQPTLEQAVALAVKADTPDRVVAVWNTYKGLYGAATAFKKAIKDNPHNPGRE